MFTVTKTDLPSGTLLQRYSQRADCFTDCFFVDLSGDITLEEFVMSFYKTWLFNLEKWILDRTIKRPSDDDVLAALASGRGPAYAAWDVEDRAENQLLLADISGGRTRSWLMAQPQEGATTRLYFGSAVLPPREGAGLGPMFTALLGFHNLYSYGLLGACARDLRLTKGAV